MKRGLSTELVVFVAVVALALGGAAVWQRSVMTSGSGLPLSVFDSRCEHCGKTVALWRDGDLFRCVECNAIRARQPGRR